MLQLFVQIQTTWHPTKKQVEPQSLALGLVPSAVPKELRLQEDSRELAGMLMKNKPGTTMKGCNFLDLMVTWTKLRNDVLKIGEVELCAFLFADWFPELKSFWHHKKWNAE